MKRRRTYFGEQACCALCAQDIEWHGKQHKWIDRGGNRSCVPYRKDGEIVTPPKTAKHKPARE